MEYSFFGFRYADSRQDTDGYISAGLAALFSFFAFGWLALLVIPAGYLLFRYGLKNADRHVMQVFVTCGFMAVIGFSTIGVIVIRANAAPPINMNSPSDPIRLLSYVNREQYGERPLLYGPHFAARPDRQRGRRSLWPSHQSGGWRRNTEVRTDPREDHGQVGFRRQTVLPPDV